MLFRRLLEFHRSSTASRVALQGLLISSAAHLVIVVTPMLQRDPEARPKAPAETFTRVEFLVPPDRLERSRPQQEKITWTSLASGSGMGYAEPAQPARPDEERLKEVVARGESVQPEAAKPAEEAQPPIALGDSIMTELQVDSAVTRYDDSAAPPYPETMLKRRIEGLVLVQYVVDTLGRADTTTFRILTATHNDFARAVKNTLPRMRFHPAIMANHRVPQLVQQPFAFKIVDTALVAGDRRKLPQS